MTGRHSLVRPRRTWPRWVTALGGFITARRMAAVACVSMCVAAAASVPTVSAAPTPAALYSATAASPDAGVEQERMLDDRFMAALAAAGVSAGEEEQLLLRMVHRGVAAQTTDADLRQSIRALYPDIDEAAAEKLVYQVRQVWPGPHDVDTDDDGR